jgi:hypothetical protein
LAFAISLIFLAIDERNGFLPFDFRGIRISSSYIYNILLLFLMSVKLI